MNKQNEIQEEIVKKVKIFFITRNKGLLDVTMRAGKIRITLRSLEELNSLNKKILISYPDNKILNSWQEDIEKFNIPLGNVTFTNFSSLKKYTEENWDFFIIDEPQELSENEFELSSTIINNSKKILLLTGTATVEVKNRFSPMGVKLIHKYSKEDAINDGIIADYNVTIHLVNLDTKENISKVKSKFLSEKRKFDQFTYVIEKQKELGQDTMFLSLARNRLSQNSISKRKKILSLLYELKNKRVIIFTGFTKQAESLGIPYYHSKCRSAKSLSDFNNKKFNHLALAVAGKVGANYTDLDSVILSNFTGNDATNRQLLDRAAKLDYHNKVADLHIICLNEPNEVKKLQNTLRMLDQNKIKWKT